MHRPIGVDMDGCVTNFVHQFTKWAHAVSPQAPILEGHQSMPAWEFRGWYMQDSKLEHKVLEETWRRALDSESFWKYMKPQFPAGLTRLAELHRTQPLVFITRRDGVDAYKQTADWLRVHGIEEPILIRVHSGEEKQDICKTFGIRIMIEDSPKYAEGLTDNGVHVVMPRYPYNIDFIANKGDWRVTGVGSLSEALERAVQYA